jgi:hypothetical protein
VEGARLAAGSPAAVILRLDHAAARALRRAGRLRAALVGRGRDDQGRPAPPVRRSLTLTPRGVRLG